MRRKATILERKENMEPQVSLLIYICRIWKAQGLQDNVIATMNWEAARSRDCVHIAMREFPTSMQQSTEQYKGVYVRI
jgi:hypothetical protein